MANYAILDSNGVIINKVVWDGQESWIPPEGLTYEEDINNEWTIGGTLIDSVYTPPTYPPEEPEE